MTLSPHQITVVILAGGFGTRIKQQLPDLPKPLAPWLTVLFWIGNYVICNTKVFGDRSFPLVI